MDKKPKPPKKLTQDEQNKRAREDYEAIVGKVGKIRLCGCGQWHSLNERCG